MHVRMYARLFARAAGFSDDVTASRGCNRNLNLQILNSQISFVIFWLRKNPEFSSSIWLRFSNMCDGFQAQAMM